MKKIISGTPVLSIFIFLFFCIWFEKLTSVYEVDCYRQYETSIVEIDRKMGLVTLEIKEGEAEEGVKVNMIYSDKKPVLKGIVKKSENSRATVYFEKMMEVEDEELEHADFEFVIGRESIGVGLNLWK